MSFLLDTCVLSELVRTSPHANVATWFAQQQAEALYVSALTVGEIETGLALLDEGRKRMALASWLAELRASYGGRILAIDETIATVWGRITATARKRGRPLKTIDALIAASALHHGFTVVTRNVADFETTGAAVLNPWSN